MGELEEIRAKIFAIDNDPYFNPDSYNRYIAHLLLAVAEGISETNERLEKMNENLQELVVYLPEEKQDAEEK